MRAGADPPAPAAAMAPPALLHLSRAAVASLLPPLPARIALVERTFRALAAGRVELPPKPGIHPRPGAFIHAMPAYLADDDIAALKWIGGFPENPARGLPYISGLIVLNDAGTGLPVAVMDGAEITAARTAAVSGLCIERFAPAGWSSAAIVGCGEQGRYHAEMLAALRPGADIRAYDPVAGRAAAVGGGARPVASLREAVQEAEVVITAAPLAKPARPVLEPEWPAPGCLLLPIDFDATMRPEAVAACGLVLADDVAQFAYYRSLGWFAGWPEPAAGLGESLAASPPDRVACVNLGIGALDAAFAAAIAGSARDAGCGTILAR